MSGRVTPRVVLDKPEDLYELREGRGDGLPGTSLRVGPEVACDDPGVGGVGAIVESHRDVITGDGRVRPSCIAKMVPIMGKNAAAQPPSRAIVAIVRPLRSNVTRR